MYEGTVVKRGAVLGSGTILNRSTPVYDVVRGEVYIAAENQPLIIPEKAVVVPGSRPINRGQRKRVGPVPVHAGNRKISQCKNRPAHPTRGLAPLKVEGTLDS